MAARARRGKPGARIAAGDRGAVAVERPARPCEEAPALPANGPGILDRRRRCATDRALALRRRAPGDHQRDAHVAARRGGDAVFAGLETVLCRGARRLAVAIAE